MVGRTHIVAIALTVGLALGSVAATSAIAAAQGAHRVRSGDSLARIAHRNGVSVRALAAANRISTTTPLRQGQVLVVPERGTVYVGPGQTLSHIARENDCSIDALARANRMRPSGTLRAGQLLRLPGYEAVAHTTRPAEGWGEPSAPGTVAVRTWDERASVRLRDAEGRVLAGGLTELTRLMDRHDLAERRAEAIQGETIEGEAPVEDAPAIAPHPRLALLLAAISDHFGGREIAVVSGFREARRFTRNTSRHVHGQAVDIRIIGVPARELWDFCRSLSETGCGLYPHSTFVHVDIRKQAAQWVDWSGPGQRPRYGGLRGPFRRRARAHQRQRESLGRSITRPDLVPRFLEVGDSEPAPALPRAERSGSAPSSS